MPTDDLTKELREIVRFPPDCSAKEAAAMADVASRAADEIERLRSALGDYRWALRETWDYLAADEEVEVDGGPEVGMYLLNVRSDIWTSIIESFDTDDEAERFDQTLTEALDE